MKEYQETPVKLMPRPPRKQPPKRRPKFRRDELLARTLGFFLARAVPIPGLAPFGLAFLAMDKRVSPASFFSLLMVSLGYFSLADGRMLVYLAAGVCYQLFLVFLHRSEAAERTGALLAATLACALADAGAMLWEGLSLGGVLRACLDVSLTALGVMVFERCRGLVEGRLRFGRIRSKEERLSLCVLFGIGLLSFHGIPLPVAFSLGNLLALTAAGVAGIGGGVLAGTVTGLGCGLVLGSQGELLNCLAVFGCCGLAAGLTARRGRYMAVSAMTAVGVLLSVYALYGGGEAIRFYEVLTAAVLLAVLPGKVFAEAQRLADFTTARPDGGGLCCQQLQDRLALAAGSFDTLAETFVQISDKQSQVEMQDIAMMFDTTAERVCRVCSRVEDCWQTRFGTTYKNLFRLLEILERKGTLETAEAEVYFSGRCLRTEALVKELSRQFEVYKINQVWQSKLCENRELVSQQFRGVAEILRRMSGELAGTTAFDSLAADEITCRLRSRGVPTERVQVLQTAEARYAVQLSLATPPDETACRMVSGVLKGVLGRGFLPAEYIESADGGGRIRFYEAPQFRVAAGYASAGKQEENGDSHILHLLRGGKFIATLSDGMGSGRSASRESGAIVTLLEDFMEAGFDKTVAVRLINSVMVMKSAGEAFATVDMCMIDLYTGAAECIKNGAEPSYIRHKGRTETVRSASLPVGVVSQVEIESFAHTLDAGDVVVMVSDGLALRQGGEDWLRHAVDALPSELPPQEIADRLMEQAIALKGGAADDDMTVLALQLAPRGAS